MDSWLSLALGILLTVGTGLFVASEFSMVNLERSDLEARQARGQKGLSNTIRALKKTSTHLSGAQLGITLTTMLTGFLAEPALTHLLSDPLTSWGIAEADVEPIALALGMFLATVFSTLVGELIPKKLALTIPLEVNRFVVVFQLIFTFIFGWAVKGLNIVGDGVVRLFGFEPKEELSSSRTAEELASLVRRAAAEGALDSSTATLITKTIALSQLTAADIMTARPKMHVVNREQTAADVVALTNSTGHSRFPVIEEDTDDVVGLVHVKKAAAIARGERDKVKVATLVTPVERVPETMKLETLLGTLRAKGMQIALVVDEYGGTAGLVTLEDLVEELVGELQDEHDRSLAGIRRGGGKSILFPGLMRPDELGELAIKIPDVGAYETVGGFIMQKLGRLAEVGDVIEIDGGELRVERMDGRRIDRVRFTPEEVGSV
ncbi:MAG: hemolysin family protein [Micrococcales bacterium]